MDTANVQYLSNEQGALTNVLIPIELWKNIVSELEATHLLKSETTKLRVLEAQRRDKGFSLNPTDSVNLEPVSELSDKQVLALTKLQMQPDQDAQLSKLLDLQQAGLLGENECSELQKLMQIYQEALLKKAYALNEAVKRELIEPLSNESNF
ncbi:MAG: hypothetical protein AAFV72_18940 [Cyanobacteria bacterium J06635_1]